MNLQAIQKRVEELSAELLTLSNNLAFILEGDVERTKCPVVDRDSYWAEGLREGDLVKCVAIHSTNKTRLRSFTLGKVYIVEERMTGRNPSDPYYGIRVLRDDEGDGHDAADIVFVKVSA